MADKFALVDPKGTIIREVGTQEEAIAAYNAGECFGWMSPLTRNINSGLVESI